MKQTEGKMQTTDCRVFDWIMLSFLSLRANPKQANRSIIQANQSNIQVHWHDIQANQSADLHKD